MSEDRLTQVCYLWWHNTHREYRGLLFHVPNGGSRNKREAAKFQIMGLYPGISDFIFLWGGMAFMIELKTEKGRQSPEQFKWQVTMEAQGFEYYIVRSLEAFQVLIGKIMG